MARYKAKVRFIFEGIVEVEANDGSQAQEHIDRHVGLCIGGDIHTTLDDEDVDWDFNVHPEKEIEILGSDE